MKIKFYGYNTFILESSERKIAIDPGTSFYIFTLGKSMIPKEDWEGLTHLFITHGDPDHADAAGLIAKETGAKIIGGIGLQEGLGELRKEIQKNGLSCSEIEAGQVADFDGITVEGLETRHGILPLNIIPGMFKMTGEVVNADEGGLRLYLGPLRLLNIRKPMKVYSTGTISLLCGLLSTEKDNVPFAVGSIGLKLTFDGKTIVNLGDTLLMDSWHEMSPDVLMIPIGGREVHNTMDEKEALEAVRIMQPKLVIPCHYNCAALFSKKLNPADDQMFKSEVIKMGLDCKILSIGEEINI